MSNSIASPACHEDRSSPAGGVEDGYAYAHLQGDLPPSAYGVSGAAQLTAGIESLGFYSGIARAIAGGPGRAAPEQWLEFVGGLTRAGVKADEIIWSGLCEWIDSRRDGLKISRAEVCAFLLRSSVTIAETQLFASPLDRSRTSHADGANDARYADYVLPGATNYREVLLSLSMRAAFEDERVARKRYGDAVRACAPESEQAKLKIEVDQAERVVAEDRQYKNTNHWGDRPNVIAHMRLNDRVDLDGRRVLFVEEMQSDWSFAAKSTGCRDDAVLAAAAARAKATGQALRDFVCRVDGGLTINASIVVAVDDLLRHVLGMQVVDQLVADPALETEARMLLSAAEKASTALARARKAADVPPGPFIGHTTSWVSLLLKRLIRIAVDGGYDGVAFITGKQSADRYALSGQISTVDYIDLGGGSFDITALDDSGKIIVRDPRMTKEEVAMAVGVDIANMMADGSGEPISSEPQCRRLRGCDANIGGSGLRSFYDDIVINTTRTLNRKLGGGGIVPFTFATPYEAVRERSGGRWCVLDGAGAVAQSSCKSRADAQAWIERRGIAMKQPGFEITAEMREIVLCGLPLFGECIRLLAVPQISEQEKHRQALRRSVGVASHSGGRAPACARSNEKAGA